MTPAEWLGVLGSAAVFPKLLDFAITVVKARMASRRSERPQAGPAIAVIETKTSSSSDNKLKAVVADIDSAATIKKVDEIHEALAGKDPLTKGYIIPEHLRNQTNLLATIKEEAVKQTAALNRIASNSPPPVPPRTDTRYRGGGGE